MSINELLANTNLEPTYFLKCSTLKKGLTMESITRNQMKQLDDHIIYYDENLNNVKQALKKLNYSDAIIRKCDDLYVAFDN